MDQKKFQFFFKRVSRIDDLEDGNLNRKFILKSFDGDTAESKITTEFLTRNSTA